MEATKTEIQILNCLLQCSFQPGSFDKKFPKDINPLNISPLQKYWIHKLGYKYRKQIGSDILEAICKNYIDSTPEPLSRKQSEKILKQASK